MEAFVELLKLGAVGIIAGLFSLYVSNREHRNKRWWELRVSAYQAVIEALSDLNYYFETNYNAEIECRELSKEYEEKLSKFWDESYHKVRKAADSGAFIFSDNVNKALKEFVNLKEEHHNTYFEYLDSNIAIAARCLKTVVECSRKDLKVRDSWL